ncbi:secretion protein F, partial [Pseudomonas sp. HMWF010]
MLVVLAAILGFITIAGIGFVFAGGDQSSARTVKRAQAIAGGGARDASARAKAVANTPDARRKQILKTLK